MKLGSFDDHVSLPDDGSQSVDRRLNSRAKRSRKEHQRTPMTHQLCPRCETVNGETTRNGCRSDYNIQLVVSVLPQWPYLYIGLCRYNLLEASPLELWDCTAPTLSPVLPCLWDFHPPWLSLFHPVSQKSLAFYRKSQEWPESRRSWEKTRTVSGERFHSARRNGREEWGGWWNIPCKDLENLKVLTLIPTL